jgi:hypothetical protein
MFLLLKKGKYFGSENTTEKRKEELESEEKRKKELGNELKRE